ncbi:type II toxin-antitoxin system RatA family toxin [Acetobacteraceae bacterium]|nr:type II toxin-antitoxin system RatA family toxin [Acetobacteraceae bacterium]
MATVKESKVTPYSAEEFFALVADVGTYPDFLPWCIGAKITPIKEDEFLGAMTIGNGMLKESYESHVHLYPHEKIISTSKDGPFKSLRNEWCFKDLPEGGCLVECRVDFEFRSIILGKLAGGLFAENSRKMIQAFIDRAVEKYGKR